MVAIHANGRRAGDVWPSGRRPVVACAIVHPQRPLVPTGRVAQSRPCIGCRLFDGSARARYHVLRTVGRPTDDGTDPIVVVTIHRPRLRAVGGSNLTSRALIAPHRKGTGKLVSLCDGGRDLPSKSPCHLADEDEMSIGVSWSIRPTGETRGSCLSSREPVNLFDRLYPTRTRDQVCHRTGHARSPSCLVRSALVMEGRKLRPLTAGTVMRSSRGGCRYSNLNQGRGP